MSLTVCLYVIYTLLAGPVNNSFFGQQISPISLCQVHVHVHPDLRQRMHSILQLFKDNLVCRIVSQEKNRMLASACFLMVQLVQYTSYTVLLLKIQPF